MAVAVTVAVAKRQHQQHHHHHHHSYSDTRQCFLKATTGKYTTTFFLHARGDRHITLMCDRHTAHSALNVDEVLIYS